MARGAGDIIVEFFGDLSELKKAFGEAEDGANKWKATATKAAAVVGGAFAATKVAGFLEDATAAAEEDEKSQRLLATQIRDSTSATNDQIAGVEAFINKLARQTGVMDDDLRPAYASLVRATGDVNEAQTELATAMDIAAGKGVDLGTVTAALEKAHNGQTGALGRLGLATKDASGNALTLNQIMEQAGQKFAGAAEAAVTPSQRWKVATEELKESLGAHLLPIVGAIENALSGLLGWFDGLSPRMQTAIEVGVALAAALVALSVIIPVVTSVVAALGVVIGVVGGVVETLTLGLTLLLSPIGLIVLGIAALAAGLIYAYTHFQTFHDIVDAVMHGIQDVVTTVIGAISAVISGFISAAEEEWHRWQGTIEGVWNAVSGTVKANIAIILAVVQPIVDLLHGDWGKAWDDFKEQIGKAWEGIKQATEGAVAAVIGFLGNILEFLVGLPTQITIAAVGMFKGLISAAEQAVEDIVGEFAKLPGKILDVLPGPVQTAVKAAGWVTGVTPATKLIGAAAGILGRASGGSVGAGMPYTVGEHGPETFVPGMSGAIIPNGAGWGTTITMTGPVYVQMEGAYEPAKVVEAVQKFAQPNGGVFIPGGVRS